MSVDPLSTTMRIRPVQLCSADEDNHAVNDNLSDVTDESDIVSASDGGDGDLEAEYVDMSDTRSATLSEESIIPSTSAALTQEHNLILHSKLDQVQAERGTERADRLHSETLINEHLWRFQQENTQLKARVSTLEAHQHIIRHPKLPSLSELSAPAEVNPMHSRSGVSGSNDNFDHTNDGRPGLFASPAWFATSSNDFTRNDDADWLFRLGHDQHSQPRPAISRGAGHAIHCGLFGSLFNLRAQGQSAYGRAPGGHYRQRSRYESTFGTDRSGSFGSSHSQDYQVQAPIGSGRPTCGDGSKYKPLSGGSPPAKRSRVSGNNDNRRAENQPASSDQLGQSTGDRLPFEGADAWRGQRRTIVSPDGSVTSGVSLFHADDDQHADNEPVLGAGSAAIGGEPLVNSLDNGHQPSPTSSGRSADSYWGRRNAPQQAVQFMWESGVRNNGRQLAWGAPPVRPPHARARLASGGGLSGGSYGQRPQLEPLFDSGVRTARPFLFGNSRGSVSGFGTTWTQSSFGGGLFGNTLSQNGAVFGHGTGDSYIDGLFEEQPRFLDGLIDLVSC